MRTWIKNNALILGILVIPFVILAMMWNQIPDIVPLHWNAQGVADDFGPKMPGMLILPIAGIFVQLVFWALPYLDPKKEIQKFAKTLKILQLIFAFLFLALYLLIHLTVIGWIENSSALVLPLIILSLAFMGNYFTRLRPNYFVGIRTPWTLENEDNWRKTHRLGGRLWVGMSFGMLLLYFLINVEVFVWILIPGVLLMAIIPLAYSFWLYRKEKVS
ncbi:MAG: SdpI family protein [Bacteroidia bacterium]|nr:SdpI family protein [Bacteroidia bacterium]